MLRSDIINMIERLDKARKMIDWGENTKDPNSYVGARLEIRAVREALVIELRNATDDTIPEPPNQP
jgi:hypothetical protein